MRNTLGVLSLLLFAQLEKITSDDLKGEELKEEVARTKAISLLAKQIIDYGTLVLEAQKMMDNRMDAEMELPRMLEG